MSAVGRKPIRKARASRQAYAGLPGPAPRMRAAGLKAFATLACAFALAVNGLWPMAPMPKAWTRTALPVGLRVAFCGASFPLGPGAPKTPSREDPRSNPLTCPLCQLAHGTSTASATPPIALPEPIEQQWAALLPASSSGASQTRTSRLGARAPPRSLRA
jgi:hypothetical protein